MPETEPPVLDVVIPSYEGLPTIVDTITALLDQELPAGCILSVIVADDGSSDGTEVFLEERFGRHIKVIRSNVNHGRSSACNMGASHGVGDYILFLDSDCVPIGASFLVEHLQSLATGGDVSCGTISSLKNDFWAEYQHRLARKRQAAAGKPEGVPSGTTANILVRRTCFEKVGGFDVRYKHYGFEDRDFLLRMRDAGSLIRYTPGAVVSHEDDLDLREVCRKMQISGQYSSVLFRKSHPQAYRTMVYSRFDARVHPWLLFISLLSRPVLPFFSWFADSLLGIHRVPIGLRSMGVKIVSALYYLKGTTLASR